jgi:hypothetical protein
MTARRDPARRRAAGRIPVSAVIYLACLVVAACWYALQTLHITVASPPPLPIERTARVAAFLDYFRTTVPQQCGALLFASAGFAAFYVLTDRTTSIIDRPWPARTCRLGATLFITAQLIQLGGYRHLYDTSPTSGRDPEADLVTLQLVDAIDDALELGAFTLLAAGMLGLGISSHAPSSARAWSRSSTFTGLIYLALAAAMSVAACTAVDVLLIVGGTIASPVWALTLARATRE